VKIAYVLYPDFTALDLVGPYEVISRWPDAEVHFLGRGTPDTLPDPDLIVVPGGGNPVPVLSDAVLVDWLRAAAPPRPQPPDRHVTTDGGADGHRRPS
jgi:putative intracellular protease/amidase